MARRLLYCAAMDWTPRTDSRVEVKIERALRRFFTERVTEERVRRIVDAAVAQSSSRARRPGLLKKFTRRLLRMRSAQA